MQDEMDGTDCRVNVVLSKLKMVEMVNYMLCIFTIKKKKLFMATPATYGSSWARD